MKIIQVTYTITSAYVEQNKRNIQLVMAELRKLNRPGLGYFSCLSEDGKTFIHTAFFESDEDQQVLSELVAFQQFQRALQSSVPEVPPRQEILTLVDSTTMTGFKSSA